MEDQGGWKLESPHPRSDYVIFAALGLRFLGDRNWAHPESVLTGSREVPPHTESVFDYLDGQLLSITAPRATTVESQRRIGSDSGRPRMPWTVAVWLADDPGCGYDPPAATCRSSGGAALSWAAFQGPRINQRFVPVHILS